MHLNLNPNPNEPSLDPSNLAYTTFTHTNGTVYTFNVVGELPYPASTDPFPMPGSGGGFDYATTIAKTDIKSVRIGTNVTSIGGNAFQYCTSMESVTIPNTVTTLGGGSFFGCPSLLSVTIPDSVTNLPSYTFFSCSAMVSVSISNSITKIEREAFDSCSSLLSVTIPDNVTELEQEQYNCTSLNSVTIGNNLSIIGYAAFRNSNLTTVTLPDTITVIGGSAFEGSNLTTVYISSTGASGAGLTIGSTVTLGGKTNVQILELAAEPEPEPEPEPASVEQFYVYQSGAEGNGILKVLLQLGRLIRVVIGHPIFLKPKSLRLDLPVETLSIFTELLEIYTYSLKRVKTCLIK